MPPTYFYASLYFLALWIFFFFYKTNKYEQIVWSLVGIFLGPIVQLSHTIDWWNPNYLNNLSMIHLEDILFGFSVCGIL